jgi:hypothetical protein
MTLDLDSITDKKMTRIMEAIKQIWGSRPGEGYLMDLYTGKTNEAAIQDLIVKLKESKKVIHQHIPV